MIKYAIPVELNDQLKRRIDEIGKELKITEDKKKKLSFFQVTGENVRNFGSLKFTKPAIIGIPRNYDYNLIEDIDVTALMSM